MKDVKYIPNMKEDIKGLSRNTMWFLQALKHVSHNPIVAENFMALLKMPHAEHRQREDHRMQANHFCSHKWLYHYFFLPLHSTFYRTENKLAEEEAIIRKLQTATANDRDELLKKMDFGVMTEMNAVTENRSENFTHKKLEITTTNDSRFKLKYGAYNSMFADMAETIVKYGYDPDFLASSDGESGDEDVTEPTTVNQHLKKYLSE